MDALEAGEFVADATPQEQGIPDAVVRARAESDRWQRRHTTKLDQVVAQSLISFVFKCVCVCV